jgi:hypothetical protein
MLFSSENVLIIYEHIHSFQPILMSLFYLHFLVSEKHINKNEGFWNILENIKNIQ